MKPGGFDVVETDNRWDEVAVAIRIVRNAASTHIANRLREVYREYLEKYAHAVSQVNLCTNQASFTVLEIQKWIPPHRSADIIDLSHPWGCNSPEIFHLAWFTCLCV